MPTDTAPAVLRLTLHVRRGRRRKGFTQHFRCEKGPGLRDDTLRWQPRPGHFRSVKLEATRPGWYVLSIGNREYEGWLQRLGQNYFEPTG